MPEFRLTDEQGTQYYFKAGDIEERELKGAYQEDPESSVDRVIKFWHTTRWVVDEVRFANGNKIKYTYNDKHAGSLLRSPDFSATEHLTNTPAISDPQLYYGQSFKTLNTIYYPDNTAVSFHYESTPGVHRCDYDYSPALRKIKVTNGSRCQVYSLHHSYFVAQVPGGTHALTAPYGSDCNNVKLLYTYRDSTYEYIWDMVYRLKLDSIRLWDCSETYAEPYYSFEYDPTPLGIRGSGQDYYGYYNGKMATYTTGTKPYGFNPAISIPLHTVVGISYGLDKTPDINAKACILTKVKNAYGGTVTYAYEMHSGLTNPLSSILPSDLEGKTANDGIRLASITEQDVFHNNNNRKTEFFYAEGERFLPGGYFKYPIRENVSPSNPPVTIGYTGNFTTPGHLVNGSNHGYGKVTVRTSADGQQLSKREYVFTKFSDVSFGGSSRYHPAGSSGHYFSFPYTDKQYIKDWELGLPLSITDYDQNDRILKKTVHTYKDTLDFTLGTTKKVLNQKRVLVPYQMAPVLAYQYPDTFAPGRTVYAPRVYTNDYTPYWGKSFLVKTTTYTYVADNNYILDSVTYSYDKRGNLEYTVTRDSDGRIYIYRNIYNYSIQDLGMGNPILDMTMAGLEKLVGTEKWWRQDVGDVIVDASIHTFDWDNYILKPRALYTLAIAAPLDLCYYAGICGGPGLPNRFQKIIDGFNNNNTIAGFRKMSEATAWDGKSNVTESRLLGQDMYKAIIWDTISGNKLAEVNNAHYPDIAYTSFEDNPITFGIMSPERGNWSYINSNIETMAGAPSGRKVFRLDYMFGLSKYVTGVQNLANNKYLLSFWVKGSTLPKVTYGGNDLPAPKLVYGPTATGWNNYQLVFTTNVPGKVQFSTTGATIYIDEIRLHPYNAQMISQTYEPLCGPGSVTDATGRITYYEYDRLGRLYIVRDQEGNILSKTKQVVQGAD